jgi:hypothetical protein
MSDSKWHKGPPPSVGWWPASAYGYDQFVRWWNGSFWSEGAWTHEDKHEAKRCASRPAMSDEQRLIKWQHRPASWPKRSRT